jgi:putative SOS response-associated peptidase YedK
LVYGLLTTTPNAIVRPIHPKAAPAILTTPEERDVWMRALATKQKRFNGHCRIMPSVSSAVGPPKKTAPRHEIGRSATSYRE